ncbi:ATP-binding protein [Paenibacillus sp. NPDC056579]|uniref:HAMP domain-containing sensor histidine kinase n=1 Tax=Paenibacillus sp. NPDC056579 TaxID=3345871 RepID=UPI00368134BC
MKLRFAASVVGFLVVTILFWTIAFLITAYMYDARDREALWADMLESGSKIALLSGPDSGEMNAEMLMKQLALLKKERIVLIDTTGRKLDSGGADASAFAQSIDPADVAQVLSGDILQRVDRPNLFMAGFAVTGQTLMLGGRPYALFIQAEALSLFHDYGKQLLTVVVDLLLFYIVILCATPARKKQMQALKNMVAAIRKIARGDFNVTFTALHNRGPWGELSQSLNHMAVELNQMEQMRQEFISNVSHEIQSPLTSISGFARALRNEQLNPEERLHYLDIIETESKRLSKLSDNLLKLTSLESNHHPYEPKPYRLDKQLRRIVLACEPQWLDKAIDMDVDLEEVTVHADEDMLSQVWVNLINNCIKFTPDKGTIGIHLQRLADSAVIRITDTGIGIAQEDLEHIFERFYKADKSRNRSGKSNGSGLGLSIVKKIVEMHHGSIQVQSRLGEGTTFTVTLPISS